MKNLRSLVSKKASAIKGLFYDRMLGIETGDDIRNPVDRFVAWESDISRNKDMFIYGPVFYGMLKRMIRCVNPGPEDVFIDLGSGKGRAVFYMATLGLKSVIGVELDPALMAVARKNLAAFRMAKAPIHFVNGDAANYQFTDENIIFINNSFGNRTLEKVLDNIRKSLETMPRRIRIVYLNPQHKEVLASQDWLFLKHTKDMDTCYIWSNYPSG